MAAVEVTVDSIDAPVAVRVARRMEAGGVSTVTRRCDGGITFELSSDDLAEGDLRSALAYALIQIVGHYDGFMAAS